VCLLMQRDPIVTAKAVASVDVLSDGRLLFGVGAGWNVEEMRNHGTDPATRFRLLRERVEAMRAIWTHDEASYHGRLVDFDRIWSWPKPARHLPVLVGGTGARVLDRVLAYGDGWLPNPRQDAEEETIARVGELARRAAELGREAPPVTIFGARTDQALVERYAEAGVERCAFWIQPAPEDAVRARIEELRTFCGMG
jgi:probable F420-dependent oxidoreductase